MINFLFVCIIGTTLFKVSATDQDGRDNDITYNITGSTMFAIDQTGAITHKSSFPLLSNLSEVSYYVAYCASF